MVCSDGYIAGTLLPRMVGDISAETSVLKIPDALIVGYSSMSSLCTITAHRAGGGTWTTTTSYIVVQDATGHTVAIPCYKLSGSGN